MKSTHVDHNELYRFPWTLSDNAISWLEPTSECNLQCDGCYRENKKGSHKSLEEVRAELDVFQSQRKSDCISIAGGDPLLYPHIVELVAEIKRRGWKPILNTNGKALTEALLKDHIASTRTQRAASASQYSVIQWSWCFVFEK